MKSTITWKPIETAPEDRKVIVCDKDGNTFAAYRFTWANRYIVNSWAISASYNGTCEFPIDGKRLRYWAEFPKVTIP